MYLHLNMVKMVNIMLGVLYIDFFFKWKKCQGKASGPGEEILSVKESGTKLRGLQVRTPEYIAAASVRAWHICYTPLEHWWSCWFSGFMWTSDSPWTDKSLEATFSLQLKRFGK